MRRAPVTSSSIASVGYDAQATLLEIGFHNGTVYRYHLVPQRVHRELMAATSLGRFFNAEIRPRYRGVRVS